MGKQLTESQVLQQLDIPDFRHITKDKVMEFASLLNSVEPEVAKKAIEQFPEFSRMALEALQEYKGVMEKTMDSNDASVKRCYNIYDEVVSALKACANRDDISFEERKYYIDRMMEIARLAHEQDGKNKQFNWRIIGGGAAAVALALSLGAGLLGVNSHFHFPGGKK